MCGIWGIVQDYPATAIGGADVDIVRSMMYVTAIRGDHSTGICAVPVERVKHGPRIMRAVGGPGNLLHSENAKDFFPWADKNATIIFGHGRWATKGDIKVSNAHPFSEGDWILVHNGTIYNGVTQKEGVEVDSHALCQKIEEIGIREALRTIDGAYAIIAYNKKEKKLYAARNAQRPLFFFRTFSTTYIMSEKEALIYLMQRHNRTYQATKTNDFTEFKVGSLYVSSKDGMIDIDSVQKVYTPPAPVTVPHSYPRIQNLDVVEGPPNTRVRFRIIGMEAKGHQATKYFAKEIGTSYCDQLSFIGTDYDIKMIEKVGSAVLGFKVIHKTRGNFVEGHLKYNTIEWERAPSIILACENCSEPVEELDPFAIRQPDGKIWCGDCVDDYTRNKQIAFGMQNLDADDDETQGSTLHNS